MVSRVRGDNSSTLTGPGPSTIEAKELGVDLADESERAKRHHILASSVPINSLVVDHHRCPWRCWAREIIMAADECVDRITAPNGPSGVGSHVSSAVATRLAHVQLLAAARPVARPSGLQHVGGTAYSLRAPTVSTPGPGMHPQTPQQKMQVRVAAGSMPLRDDATRHYLH